MRALRISALVVTVLAAVLFAIGLAGAFGGFDVDSTIMRSSIFMAPVFAAVALSLWIIVAARYDSQPNQGAMKSVYWTLAILLVAVGLVYFLFPLILRSYDPFLLVFVVWVGIPVVNIACGAIYGAKAGRAKAKPFWFFAFALASTVLSVGGMALLMGDLVLFLGYYLMWALFGTLVGVLIAKARKQANPPSPAAVAPDSV